MLVPLMLPPYKQAHSDTSVVECINMYPADVEYDQVSRTGNPGSFQHTSGYDVWCDLDGTVVRGTMCFNNLAYAVVDNTFYRIDSGGGAENAGTLTSTVGRIRMECNGDQIWIVNCQGVDSYVYTISTQVFAVLSDVNYPANDSPSDPVIFTEYSDGYGIAVTASGRLQLSNRLDFTTWNPLAFAVPGYQADRLKAVIVSKEELTLLSDTTVEFWYNSGDTFPYTRRSLASLKYGVAAPHSAIAVDDSAMWLTKNEQGQGYIVKTSQYSIQRISSEFIEKEISTYKNIEDAFSVSYYDQGRLFFQITFPTAGTTWVYDLATDMWHKRTSQSHIADANGVYNQSRHTANNAMNVAGQIIIGDYQSGKLYQLHSDIYTEDGRPIQRMISSATMQQELNRISVSELELEINMGESLSTGQGSDPLIGLQYSTDRAHTWGARRDVSMGKIGEYKTRVKWNRLGQARYWNVRFLMSEPIPFKILRATAHGSIEGQGQQGRQ